MSLSAWNVLPSAFCVAGSLSFFRSQLKCVLCRKSFFRSLYPKRALSPLELFIIVCSYFFFLHKVSVYLFFSSAGLLFSLTCLGKGSRALSVLFPESDTSLVCGRSSRSNLRTDLCWSFCAQNKIQSFPWPTRLLALLSNVISDGAFSEDA